MSENNNLVAFFNDTNTTSLVVKAKSVYTDIEISKFTCKEDFEIASTLFDKVEQKAVYKKAKMIEKLETLNLNGTKAFDLFASEIVGLKKSSIYNYKNVAKWLDENGDYSLIVGEVKASDFDYSKIEIMQRSGLPLETWQELYQKGEIIPSISVQKLTAFIKKQNTKKDDITADSTITEIENEKAEKAEKTEKTEKTEKPKETKTIQTLFNEINALLLENNFVFGDLLKYYESIK